MYRFPEGGTNVGVAIQPGLPNISGRINVKVKADAFATTGVFASKLDTTWVEGRDNVPALNYIDFNASWSNPIYGRSYTVQPNALVLLPIIKAI